MNGSGKEELHRNKKKKVALISLKELEEKQIGEQWKGAILILK